MMVRVSDQRRQSQLDLLHNAERDTQRQPAFLARHYHRRFASERGDETFLLQLQRFAIGGMQPLTLDVGSDIGRSRLDRFRIEARLEFVKFAGSTGEIERQILTLLENADLPLLLTGDATGSDVGDRT